MTSLLLLEDEPLLANLYKKSLDANGYLVTTVSSGKALEELLPTIRAEVVILDHGLKEESITGLDLVSVVLQHLPNASVFMLSNYSQFQLEEQLKKAGGKGYFVKSNTPPHILPLRLQQMLSKE